jgi:hypothetical protein
MIQRVTEGNINQVLKVQEALDTYGTLPVTPHVLVLPSDLKQFTKVTISHG